MNASLSQSLMVFIGGGLGANARYWLGGLISAKTGPAFPWGTFLINVSGAILIGLFTGAFLKLNWSGNSRLLLSIGFLGGYTTFSTFMYESLSLLQGRSYMYFALYFLGSNLAGMVGCWLGLSAMRAISGA